MACQANALGLSCGLVLRHYLLTIPSCTLRPLAPTFPAVLRAQTGTSFMPAMPTQCVIGFSALAPSHTPRAWPHFIATEYRELRVLVQQSPTTRPHARTLEGVLRQKRRYARRDIDNILVCWRDHSDICRRTDSAGRWMLICDRPVSCRQLCNILQQRCRSGTAKHIILQYTANGDCGCRTWYRADRISIGDYYLRWRRYNSYDWRTVQVY